MCSGVNRVSIFARTESPPQRGPSPHFCVDQVRFSVWIGKSRNLSKLYRSYYPHRSRELVSPVCGIFFLNMDKNPLSNFFLCINFTQGLAYLVKTSYFSLYILIIFNLSTNAENINNTQYGVVFQILIFFYIHFFYLVKTLFYNFS